MGHLHRAPPSSYFSKVISVFDMGCGDHAPLKGATLFPFSLIIQKEAGDSH